MPDMNYWLAALFLPLFPLSVAFNALFAWLRSPWVRALLLLIWPQLGLSLALAAPAAPPDALLPLALFSSALYAFRAIVVRELGQWTGYLATSAWALLWLALLNDSDATLMRLYALGFSLPLVLLALLGGWLERRFGAAYAGLHGGLAQRLPRFTAILVLVVLAITAAPLFPGFFAMLATIIATIPAAPSAALVLGLIWLLWTWAGVRLLQGLIVGPAKPGAAPDLGVAPTVIYGGLLTVLLLSGLYGAGAVL